MSCTERLTESAKVAWNEALSDIKVMTHKYPLVAVISSIIFGLLGIIQIGALTISAFLSGAILVAMGGAIVYSIMQDPAAFLEEIKKSLSMCSDVPIDDGKEHHDGDGKPPSMGGDSIQVKVLK